MRYFSLCSYLIVAILFFLIGQFGRSELDRLRRDRVISVAECPLCEIEPGVEEPLYIPTGRLLPYLSLGHKQLLADLLWLRTILYFGEHSLTDRDFPYLYHLVDIVTTLDPCFLEPYLFGGIALSLEAHAVEESNSLLQKGMKHFPNEWRIPFYLGFNYWYFKEERGQAAQYVALASQLPGAPSYLSRLAATLYLQGGQGEVALKFLREIHSRFQDERIRENLEKKMEEIARGGK
jgi:hypothetical protein